MGKCFFFALYLAAVFQQLMKMRVSMKHFYSNALSPAIVLQQLPTGEYWKTIKRQMSCLTHESRAK
ncbi:hypothetical protein C7H79_03010 [Nitrosomonas supralitoralis]|uniref:Uncharacterized protein n=1 Tax=Nitrosomonas supralitoralis TaxID=2116706 RepID=A0A2P7NY38_9PROT|nr:hypothetical protein C7H79_03010 [Nitrosomonas supralitoralis]